MTMDQLTQTGHNSSPTDRSADAKTQKQQLQIHQQFANLTGFQRDILRILDREGPLYGLAIKAGLEAYTGSEVNHGRLYPNLDTLVDEGLIAKSERDQRTNDYALSDEAEQLLDARRAWELGES